MPKVFCAGNGQLHQISMESVMNTLDCMHDQQILLIQNDTPIVLNSSGGVSRPRLTQAITREQDQETERRESSLESSGRKYVLRRLTPTECLRLQGLPDWWCDGANGSDSAIYKMAGNGIAIPCAYDVLGRIVKAYQHERTNQP